MPQWMHGRGGWALRAAPVVCGALLLQPAALLADHGRSGLPQEIVRGTPAGPQGAGGTPGALAASVGLGQTRVLPYPMEFVWPTAMRLLRVDRSYTIVDRDPDAGFILFDFPIGPEDRVGRGSVEVFATKDASGRAAASVQITTDGGPVHLPHALLDALAEKLRKERGQPAAPPRAEPPDEAPKAKPKPKPAPRPDDEPTLRPEDLPILD